MVEACRDTQVWLYWQACVKLKNVTCNINDFKDSEPLGGCISWAELSDMCPTSVVNNVDACSRCSSSYALNEISLCLLPATYRSVSVAQVPQRPAGAFGWHQEQRRGTSTGESDDQVFQETRIEVYLHTDTQDNGHWTFEPVSNATSLDNANLTTKNSNPLSCSCVDTACWDIWLVPNLDCPGDTIV